MFPFFFVFLILKLINCIKKRQRVLTTLVFDSQYMKKIAILQSNYIPWKGYFDMMNMVDTFVIYDDMQYTRRDWRNRNRIKTPNGTQWLSIPVDVKGKFQQRIDETQVNDPNWNISHWQTLKNVYSKAPYFKSYKEYFEALYLNMSTPFLSEINYRFITAINQLLGIKTELLFSTELNVTGKKTDRLLNICEQLGANSYLSGPAAKTYLVEEKFEEKNIRVAWMDYSGYKEYLQLHTPFEDGVTILDLIFNTGPDAIRYMKSFDKESAASIL